ncbi:hypothetical protein MLD38_040756 [Melastoma candidum]|nr:hypothetical protein MLD38_040756 [Melastoma candidum]
MEAEGGGGAHGGGCPTSTSISESDLFVSALGPLFNLSDALATFKQRFQELQSHLRSIDAALDSLSETNSLSDLEQLCAAMCSRGLRKYIASRLSSEPALRQSVPKALLQFALDPAKLVLDCVGGFYLQGARAFADASPMVPFRRAAILALEFFLLSGDLVSLPNGALSSEGSSLTVANEAESVALAWRKRMIAEGGISKASMIDARGLLLFVSCFGIPTVFKADDVIQLIRASDWGDIVDALRRSRHLVPRIPVLVEEMARKQMGVEAVDLAFGFSMEDKINPQEILTTSLKEAKEASAHNKEVNSANTKKGYVRRITTLKSVVRCLEAHNLDPDKVLPGLQVNDMIAKLEKDVAEISDSIQGQGQSKSKGRSSRISRTLGIKRKKTKPQAAASLSKKLTSFHGAKGSPIMGIPNPSDGGSLLVRSFDSRHLGHVASSLSHSRNPALLAEESGYPAASPMVRVGISPAAGHPREGFVEGVVIVPRVSITNPTYGEHVYREPAYPSQFEQLYQNVPTVGVGGLQLRHPSLEGFPGLHPTHSSNVPVHNDAGNPDLYRFADSV